MTWRPPKDPKPYPARCEARTRTTWGSRGRKRPCRNWAIPGKGRCRLHGGLSTGPRTAEGLTRTLAAMQEGRSIRIVRLFLEGKKINTGHKGGRYPKGTPPEMRTRSRQAQQAQQSQIEALAASQASVADEIAARHQLVRLVCRGADVALTHPRSAEGQQKRTQDMALGREAGAILSKKWFDMRDTPHEAEACNNGVTATKGLDAGGAALTLAQSLDKAAPHALEVLANAMEETNDDPDRVNLNRMRNEAAKTLVMLKARTDETSLRQKQDDNLAGLLELVLQRKAQLARDSE